MSAFTFPSTSSFSLGLVVPIPTSPNWLIRILFTGELPIPVGDVLKSKIPPPALPVPAFANIDHEIIAEVYPNVLPIVSAFIAN